MGVPEGGGTLRSQGLARLKNLRLWNVSLRRTRIRQHGVPKTIVAPATTQREIPAGRQNEEYGHEDNCDQPKRNCCDPALPLRPDQREDQRHGLVAGHGELIPSGINRHATKACFRQDAVERTRREAPIIVRNVVPPRGDRHGKENSSAVSKTSSRLSQKMPGVVDVLQGFGAEDEVHGAVVHWPRASVVVERIG